MITSSGLGSKDIKTFALLDQIVTILGGTQMCFWPFLSGVGTSIFPYGSGNDGAVVTSSNAVNNNFDPIHLNGVYAYYIDRASGENITGADNNVYSHGNGTVDTAFSTGLWFMPTDAVGTVCTLLSKYDITTAAEAREWEFRYDASGNLELELYDESADASEVGTGASNIIVPFAWNFLVATYDGTETAPAVHLYRNASDTLATGATTETGAYVSMDNGAALFRIASREGAGGTATQIAEGYVALPFVTGKELVAGEVSQLYELGKKLIGL